MTISEMVNWAIPPIMILVHMHLLFIDELDARVVWGWLFFFNMCFFNESSFGLWGLWFCGILRRCGQGVCSHATGCGLNMTAFKFSVIDAFGKLRLGCLVWSWTKTITGLSISAQLQDFCLGLNLLRFDLCQNILRYGLRQVMPAVRSAFKTWSVSCDSSMLQFVLYACFIKSWEKHFVSSWKRKLRVCRHWQSSGLSHDAFDVLQPCQKMQVLVGTTWRVSTASASQGEFFFWAALCLECFNLGGCLCRCTFGSDT